MFTAVQNPMNIYILIHALVQEMEIKSVWCFEATSSPPPGRKPLTGGWDYLPLNHLMMSIE